MGPLDFLSAKTRTTRKRAAALYAAAVAQARSNAFYVTLGAPDTLEGRFELIVLHVHLLCRRLAKLGPDGAALAQAVFDAMFHDMDRNLRELGVGDPSIPRRIKTMIEAFYGRSSAYESALATDAEAALAKALARNVFNAEAAPGAPALAKYVKDAAARIEAAPPSELLAGGVEFPAAGGG